MEKLNNNTQEKFQLNILKILTLTLFFSLLYNLNIHQIENFLYKNQKEENIEELILKGSSLTEKMKYEKDIEKFDIAIKTNPKDHHLYYLRGTVYEKLKNFDKAIDDYNMAIELSSENDSYDIIVDTKIYTKALAFTFFKKGKEYYEKGYKDNAMEYYDKAISLYPNLIIYTLPDFLKHTNEEIKAIDKKLRDIDIESLKSNYNLLMSYLYTNDCELANKEYKILKSGKENEMDAIFYISMGIYLWKCEKNKNEALKYFDKGFKKGFNQFDDLYSYNHFAILLEGLKDQEDFKSLIDKYKKTNLNP